MIILWITMIFFQDNDNSFDNDDSVDEDNPVDDDQICG